MKRRIAAIAATFLLLPLTSDAALASVILVTDPSVFLASNAIVSTETFDEFATPTLFPPLDQSVTIDSVVYADRSFPNPGWAIEGNSTLGSQPNSLVSRASVEDKMLTFVEDGDVGYVDAIGFAFLPLGRPSGEVPAFRFLVTETNGATSAFEWSDDSGYGYFGFSSTLGIRMITVNQVIVGGRTNYAFDDVSRTEVIPEPATTTLLSVGLVSIAAARIRRRRSAPGASRTTCWRGR